MYIGHKPKMWKEQKCTQYGFTSDFLFTLSFFLFVIYFNPQSTFLINVQSPVATTILNICTLSSLAFFLPHDSVSTCPTSSNTLTHSYEGLGQMDVFFMVMKRINLLKERKRKSGFLVSLRQSLVPSAFGNQKINSEGNKQKSKWSFNRAHATISLSLSLEEKKKRTWMFLVFCFCPCG